MKVSLLHASKKSNVFTPKMLKCVRVGEENMIPRVIYMYSITSDIEKWRKVAPGSYKWRTAICYLYSRHRAVMVEWGKFDKMGLGAHHTH